jgi:hypothetical protein
VTLRWFPRRFAATRASAHRVPDEECGMPAFLPLFSIPILAFLVVVGALIVTALVD